MGSEFWEHFKAERMETPLDVFAKEDKEYQKCRLKYYEERENLEKALRDKNPDEVVLLEKLDEAMCGYAARYADAAYSLGFHDGMDIGMEHREAAAKKAGCQVHKKDLEDYMDINTDTTLEGCLKEDENYKKYREKYHNILKKIERHFEKDEEWQRLILQLDETVGAYSAEYGAVAYRVAFCRGMAFGIGQRHGKDRRESTKTTGQMEFRVEDMADLVRLHDAYSTLIKTMCGEMMAFSYNEGMLGSMSWLYEIINRHVSKRIQESDVNEENQILSNVTLTPEERARLLME